MTARMDPRFAARGTPTLLGVPYDASSSFLRGAARAPAAIRKALHSPSTNLWTERLADLEVEGALADAGDVPVGRGADAHAGIEAAVGQIAEEHRRPIVLGGDHSITYPVLRALRPFHPRLTLLQLDAHPDLYEEFEGDRLSHACPFARILEDRLVDRLVQVGIRAMNAHQRLQADRFGVEVIGMPAWCAGARLRLDGPLYISIDMDAFDPAFAPGVSHREAGGLSAREVLRLIQDLAVPIVGADVVEFNPAQDPLGITAPLCAKLVKELAGKMGEPSGA